MLAAIPATRPVRSSAVGFEPITLDEAKKQCHVAGSNDAFDSEIEGYIATARRQFEKQASIAIATGTYAYRITGWGYGEFIELSDLTPITAISSVVYVAGDGVSTTWSASEYSLDTYSVAPSLKLGYGYVWPTLRGDVNGITITVVAGYASRSAVPADIKTAIKLYVRWLWYLGPGNDARQAEAERTAYENVMGPLRRDVYA